MHAMIKIAAAAMIASFALTAAACAAEQKSEPVREKAGLPETDIFLFDVTLGETVTLSNPRNVTARKGYDNQPSFTPDSAAFLFSRGDDYQTDVHEYNIATGKTKQITDTITSEYSPMPSPDNAAITFVSDGPDADQTIAVINRANPSKMSNLLPGDSLREPIGYYSVNHSTGDVLYWSRYGYNVSLTRTDDKSSRYISGNAVPSTPYIIPGTDKFSFVHRQGNEEVWIKELDPTTQTIRPLTPLKGSNANYAWSPDRTIFIIEYDVLYRWSEGEDAGWKEIADLSRSGIKGAARLAFSPNGEYLAVVGNPAK